MSSIKGNLEKSFIDSSNAIKQLKISEKEQEQLLIKLFQLKEECFTLQTQALGGENVEETLYEIIFNGNETKPPINAIKYAHISENRKNPRINVSLGINKWIESNNYKCEQGVELVRTNGLIWKAESITNYDDNFEPYNFMCLYHPVLEELFLKDKEEETFNLTPKEGLYVTRDELMSAIQVVAKRLFCTQELSSITYNANVVRYGAVSWHTEPFERVKYDGNDLFADDLLGHLYVASVAVFNDFIDCDRSIEKFSFPMAIVDPSDCDFQSFVAQHDFIVKDIKKVYLFKGAEFDAYLVVSNVSTVLYPIGIKNITETYPSLGHTILASGKSVFIATGAAGKLFQQKISDVTYASMFDLTAELPIAIRLTGQADAIIWRQLVHRLLRCPVEWFFRSLQTKISILAQNEYYKNVFETRRLAKAPGFIPSQALHVGIPTEFIQTELNATIKNICKTFSLDSDADQAEVANYYLYQSSGSRTTWRGLPSGYWGFKRYSCNKCGYVYVHAPDASFCECNGLQALVTDGDLSKVVYAIPGLMYENVGLSVVVNPNDGSPSMVDGGCLFMESRTLVAKSINSVEYICEVEVPILIKYKPNYITDPELGFDTIDEIPTTSIINEVGEDVVDSPIEEAEAEYIDEYTTYSYEDLEPEEEEPTFNQDVFQAAVQAIKDITSTNIRKDVKPKEQEVCVNNLSLEINKLEIKSEPESNINAISSDVSLEEEENEFVIYEDFPLFSTERRNLLLSFGEGIEMPTVITNHRATDRAMLSGVRRFAKHFAMVNYCKKVGRVMPIIIDFENIQDMIKSLTAYWPIAVNNTFKKILYLHREMSFCTEPQFLALVKELGVWAKANEIILKVNNLSQQEETTQV